METLLVDSTQELKKPDTVVNTIREHFREDAIRSFARSSPLKSQVSQTSFNIQTIVNLHARASCVRTAHHAPHLWLAQGCRHAQNERSVLAALIFG
eukprot:6491540-Amphidinium_carterae.1